MESIQETRPRFEFTFVMTCENARTAHLRMQRVNPVRGWLLRGVLICAVGFTVFACFTRRYGDLAMALYMWIVFAALPFLGRFRAGRHGRKMKHSPLFGQPMAIALSEADVHVRSGVSDGRVQWTLFSRATRFPDGIVLSQLSGIHTWWPKEMFGDEPTFEQVWTFVEGKIRDHRRLR